MKKCLKTLSYSSAVSGGTATPNHYKNVFFSPFSSGVLHNYFGGFWCTG